MQHAWDIIRSILTSLAGIGLIGWLLWRWLKNSEDPRRLAFKWLITAIILGFLALVVGPTVAAGGYGGAFIGIPMAAVCGLAMAIVWTPQVTAFCGRQFGQLYDGGNVEPDPQPFYSIAQARRKQGRYLEARAEVQAQLERFPEDFPGWMLLAEIQADDLHDLPAAMLTIEQLIAQPAHSPRNIAFALTRLADWQLKYNRDPDAARQSFERILERFPDSPEAHLAHQRLAHLGTREFLAATESRVPIAVPHSEERLGLRADFSGLKLPGKTPEQLVAELVEQLERFPLDNQAREELASLYAREFHRLDLAAEQLEQLISQPHAPERQTVHWLNLLADWQLQEGGDLAAGQQTLQRLIEGFPDSPAAEAAQRRLSTLNLETRAKKASQTMTLGSYEQNLGLKAED